MKRLVTTTMLGLALMGAPTHAPFAQVMQTADVAKRGLTERDFPRARQLAPGIYSYEAPPGPKMVPCRVAV